MPCLSFILACFASCSVMGRMVNITNTSSTISIVSSTFINLVANGPNAPRNSGGAIFIKGYTLYVNSSVFTNNSAAFGGAISVLQGKLKVFGNSSVFNSNYVVEMGGAIFLYQSMAELDSLSFTSNSAEEYYGAIAVFDSNGPVSITSANFVGNSAGLSGGAAGFSNSDVSIDSCLFASNSAGNTAFKASSTYDSAISMLPTSGAIFFQILTNISYNLNMTVTTFVNNICPAPYGGDISIYGSKVKLVLPSSICRNQTSTINTLLSATVQIDESSDSSDNSSSCYYPDSSVSASIAQTKESMGYNNNYFASVESQQYITTSLPQLNLTSTNTTFTNVQNIQSTVSSYRTTISITGSTFVNCKAESLFTFDAMGGSIYAAYTKVNIYNSTFKLNSATYGGAIAVLYSTLSYISPSQSTNSKLSSNKAGSGAAIYAFSSIVTVDVVEISNNTCTSQDSAAVYIASGSANITDCSFESNKNGAIYILGDTSSLSSDVLLATVKSCCFNSNTASITSGTYSGCGKDIVAEGYVNVTILSTFDTDSTKTKSIVPISYNGDEASFIITGATVTYSTSTCKSSNAPTGSGAYQNQLSESNASSNSSGLSVWMIASIAGGVVVIGAALTLFFVLRKKKDDDDNNEEEEDDYAMTKVSTTTENGVEDESTFGQSQNVPSVSLKNPLCTVAVCESSDSLFDDLDVDFN